MGISAQRPALAQEGVYTATQAARGEALFKQQCVKCHGSQLQGGEGPPLAGTEFVRLWGGPLSDLASKIRHTMPVGATTKLTPQQTADLVAYVLQLGKFPGGKVELPADEAALKNVGMTRRESTIPPAPTSAGPPPSFPAAGNLAAMMRGMLFPTSNLIFNVQSHDPGAPRPAKPTDPSKDGGFSWVDWGAGIYTGWDLVDYAAIAVAEAAPLMLIPGRRCENGRPVPVDRPDWIKFSLEMAEAGRKVYRASQTRNQEAVSDSTNDLADSCLNCHVAYRDRPGGKAARCTFR
jgi:mono/diheme cytochrome c family protein